VQWVDPDRRRVLASAINKARERAPKTVAGGTFTCWVQLVQEEPYVSVVAFVFYERIGCIGWTIELPNEVAVEAEPVRRADA
jgi:hypothetical protein